LDGQVTADEITDTDAPVSVLLPVDADRAMRCGIRFLPGRVPSASYRLVPSQQCGQDGQKKWQPLADYLSGELDRDVELESNRITGVSSRAIANGKIDLGLLGAALLTVRAAEGKKIVPLVRRVIFGSANYHGVVVVHAGSTIHSFAELRGKRFAFTDRNSTTGYALPVRYMQQQGFGVPHRFFSEVIFTGNHDSALLAVYAGTAVGAAPVDETRLDPQNLKLESSGLYGNQETIPLGPFVARRISAMP
jgi:phosphonate transport system substrate-binding protein